LDFLNFLIKINLQPKINRKESFANIYIKFIIFDNSGKYMKSKENLIGAWAILIGVVAAISLIIFQEAVLTSKNNWIYAMLAILGVIVGLASITETSRDSVTFLLATMSLVIVSYMGRSSLALVGSVGIFIVNILDALLTLFIPATIIVALKTVFSIASFK